jgi:hypothetical protein
MGKPELIMIKLKSFLKVIFPALVFFMFSSHSQAQNAPAQAKDNSTQKVEVPQLTGQGECSRNLDINKINLRDPKVTSIMPYLSGYFQCRSAMKDSIDECNNLYPCTECVDNCRLNFNHFHAFFGRLLKNKVATQSMLDTWQGFGGSKEEFDLVVKALLDDDLSVCEKVSQDKQSECRAMIGDARYCNNDHCSNNAAYIAAIKSGEIDNCDKIKEPSVRALCLGYLGKNERMCEDNNEFGYFKEIYCR